MSNPHDKFFKATFSRPEIVHNFLEEYLPPEVVAQLDLNSLELQKDSFIAPDLQEYFSDLLYRVQVKDDGLDVFVYLLLEHKSWAERLTPLQLLEYMVQIMKTATSKGQKTLPPVIPLVVYHGRQEWRVPQEFGELFAGPDELRPYWPHFRYILLDLARYEDEDIRGMALTQVGLLLLKHIANPDLFEQIPSIFSLFKDLMKVETAVEYLGLALRYLSAASREVTSEEIRVAIEATKTNLGDDIMPTIVEEWIEKGIETGRIQTQRENILDFLLIRFDAAPPELAERVSMIEDFDYLKELLRQAATAESLRDFESFLQKGRT